MLLSTGRLRKVSEIRYIYHSKLPDTDISPQKSQSGFSVPAKENAAVDKAIENAQMEIPDAMLDTQVRQMLDDFSRRMQSQGLTMEQYFQFTGMTVEKMQEEMKPQALKRIQTRLVLEKIAEVENIQPSEEEVEEEFKKMADAYKMEVEKIKELLGDRELEQMKKDMAVQKAVTLVADEAKEA